MNAQRSSYLGITSLALSLAGFTILPVIGAVAGIITGNAALNHASGAEDGFAKAGVYLGWICLVGAGLLLGLIVLSAALMLH